MKKNEKSVYNFLCHYQKMRPPRHLVQLFIWKGGLGVLDIDTQLNSKLKAKNIQKLSTPTKLKKSYTVLIELNN